MVLMVDARGEDRSLLDDLFGGEIVPQWDIWWCRRHTPVTMATTTHMKVHVLHPEESYALYKQSVEFLSMLRMCQKVLE